MYGYNNLYWGKFVTLLLIKNGSLGEESFGRFPDTRNFIFALFSEFSNSKLPEFLRLLSSKDVDDGEREELPVIQGRHGFKANT